MAGRTGVVGPDAGRVDRDPVRVVGHEVVIPLRAGLREGTYLVSYRVVSADGHPVGSGFSFVVGRPSSAPPVLPAATTPLPLRIAVGTAHWLGYAGLALLLGPLLLAARARRLVPTGWVLVFLATLGSLALQLPYTGAEMGTVLASRAGMAHQIRLALLLLALPFLHRRLVALPLLGISLLTWPLAGHPGTAPLPALAVAADLVPSPRCRSGWVGWPR